MGSGRWDPGAWRTYSTGTATKSTHEIYSSTRLDPLLDPKTAKIRESRDSADNPNSTPIIIALDVTGSMGMIADALARTGLGVLFTELLDRKPVTDPHLMFMAVGDVEYDRVPFQVSQFEADARITEQLSKIYLEGNGGGNNYESYHLPYYFAATHTAIDSFEKRGKKGYLFTIGDECVPKRLTPAQVESIFGDSIPQDLTTDDLVRMAERMYHVFHVAIEEGSYMRNARLTVMQSWQKLIGQRVIPLSDHTKLAEVVISTIQVTEGAEKGEVAASWDSSTRNVVQHALENITTNIAKASEGVVRL